MNLEMFQNAGMGSLVTITGIDPQLGAWSHRAFVPEPLRNEMPDLTAKTFLAVSDARAALAALDSTSRQLPNPQLLRLPTLRREAQSTSALEGTYAPLAEVLTADENNATTAELVEVLNYVRMANMGFGQVASGHSITVSLLSELQGVLMRGTPLHAVSGRIRDTQVVIGRRPDADPLGFPAHAARFIPSPPGLQLEANLRDLTDWMQQKHTGSIDPVVAAAMSHYQFETLHPFRDGNGRLGRFLIVLHLQLTGVLEEPTLTVSPWFEARRSEYYDRLFAVSAQGDWDGFIRFFARGLQAAADQTRIQMVALVGVQSELKERVRASALRADSAHALVDLAVANPSFNVRKVESDLNLSYPRANKLVGQLVELGVLQQVSGNTYDRRFFAPRVLQTLTADGPA
ncbi:Fic/DOC family N-terminal domain-containing protein [Microbacterium sp. SD291]|uniref:Fic family protein n=1 Tax=Microbacterium sp. SD291 TaxID=2782007 RepID=UPI001ED684FE|nr:Fic/DOC family N-terminal domain-containing protein [Microbacterium sp. SD291]MBO0981818.1 Fic family protein [Microbacterium sp. SD291]